MHATLAAMPSAQLCLLAQDPVHDTPDIVELVLGSQAIFT